MTSAEYPGREDDSFTRSPLDRARVLYDTSLPSVELRNRVENEAFALYGNTKIFISFKDIALHYSRLQSMKYANADPGQYEATRETVETAFLSGVAVSIDLFVPLLHPSNRKRVWNSVEMLDIDDSVETTGIDAAMQASVESWCALVDDTEPTSQMIELWSIAEAMYRDFDHTKAMELENAWTHGQTMFLDSMLQTISAPFDPSQYPTPYST